MSQPTLDEIRRMKKDMYDRLSPRRRRFVDRIGFEAWDPFQPPNDPIDIRLDPTGRTSQQLTSEFLAARPGPASEQYLQAVSEMTVILVGNKERLRPMYDFFVWYDKLLASEGKTF